MRWCIRDSHVWYSDFQTILNSDPWIHKSAFLMPQSLELVFVFHSDRKMPYDLIF